MLDEPTAGVDAASQDAFADALRRFVAGGVTVVLVAHELGPLEPLVTRAVVVHDGRIVHDGAVPEPAGHHAEPGHDHVHPHAPADLPPGAHERATPTVGLAAPTRVRRRRELLQYDFMVRALIGALLIGLTAPALRRSTWCSAGCR